MIEDAPEGYELSTKEELGPLVRDFHELVGRDLTNGELLALDFALEWVWASAEEDFEDRLMARTAAQDTEYGVTYGASPNIRLIPQLPNFVVARRIAQALHGEIKVRYNSRWESYKEN